MGEDSAVAITLTASDPDGDTLTFIEGAPSNGTLTGTAPNLTYTPAPNFNGSDSFTFVVKDGTVTSAAATVSITVNTANDAPVASAQALTTAEDTPLSITLSGTDRGRWCADLFDVHSVRRHVDRVRLQHHVHTQCGLQRR